MRAVVQRVAGELIEEEDRVGLILRDAAPPEAIEKGILLRYAFVTRGPQKGDHIFPAFILDDWGREIGGLKLYRWVRKHGERFPRGEIFGYERDGRETQCFLRELELYARYPCYAFADADSPVASGRLIQAVFVVDESVDEVTPVGKPEGIEEPLRRALVTWWKIPTAGFVPDLTQLTMRADPGY